MAQDSERLQYPNGVKVIPPRDDQPEEELWVLSNKFLSFQLGLLNERDINFRILKKPVGELVAGSRCEMPPETRLALQRIQDKGDSVLIIPS